MVCSHPLGSLEQLKPELLDIQGLSRGSFSIVIFSIVIKEEPPNVLSAQKPCRTMIGMDRRDYPRIAKRIVAAWKRAHCKYSGRHATDFDVYRNGRAH